MISYGTPRWDGHLTATGARATVRHTKRTGPTSDRGGPQNAARRYPAAWLVQRPTDHDMLLCSNPFGDLPAAGDTVRDAIAVALRDPAVHTS